MADRIDASDIIIEFAQETIDLMKKKLLTAMMQRGSKYGAISSAQVSRGLLQSITMQANGYNRVSIHMPYYAEFINYGVRGAKGVKEGASNSPYSFKTKMPPTSVFSGASGWIARRGINVRGFIDKQGKSRKQISNEVKKMNKRLSFLIARSIREKGIPGYHFFDFALNEKHAKALMSKLKEHFVKEIKIEIKRKN